MEEEILCNNHSNPVPAVFYCKSSDCMQGICKQCGFFHLGHEINLSISDPCLPEKIKTDILSYIQTAQGLYEENAKSEDSLNNMLGKIREETKTLVSKIKQSFSQLYEAFKKRETQLVSLAESESEDLQRSILSKLRECQEIANTQKSSLDSLGKIFKQIELYPGKEVIKASNRVFQKNPLVKPLQVSENYKLNAKFCFDFSILDDIGSSGRIFTQSDSIINSPKSVLYFFKEFCKQIYKYDLDSGTWSLLPKPSIPSFQHLSPLFVPERNLYILIGDLGERSVMVKFNPTFLTIEEETLNFEYPQWSSCVYYWENIYLVGGEVSESSSNLCRRYSPKNNAWSSIASLIIPRDSASAVGHANMIYVFGGYNNNCPLSSIERYSPSAEVWTLVKTFLPIPLAFTGSISIGTYILVLGGEFNERNSDKVFKWDGFGKIEECEALAEPFTSGSSDIIIYVAGNIAIIRADQEEFPRLEVVKY